MLKVATWNVNSVIARIDRLVAFLAREAPDVLCLQELKCVDEKFPHEALASSGYHVATHGQKTYNGVAILSRRPPDAVMRGFDDGVEDGAARFMAARFGDLTVTSSYIPNGQAVGSEQYFYKLHWLQRLRAFLDRHHKPSDAVLVTGDFNVAPADLDVHDPVAWAGQTLCTEAERAGLRGVLDFGLSDLFRARHPDARVFSWWDYRMLGFPKNHGLRIDLILGSETMAKRCEDVRVDRNERKGDKPSDHAPVIGHFSD